MMNFHNSRGMLEAIAKWLEEYEVEIDWEAVMQCKWWVGPKDWVPPPKWSLPAPFPSRLTPQTATKLLFAQWWHGLHIRPELGDPLDDYVPPRLTSQQSVVPKKQPPRGGEGVELRPAGDAATGPESWENFLRQVAAIARIEIIELKLISEEDRRALVRYAWIEEYLREHERGHNRERVRRQKRGEAVSYMSRKAIPTLIDRANKGSLEAIAELERRGWDEAEISEWRVKAKRKAERSRAEAYKRWEGGRIGMAKNSKQDGTAKENETRSEAEKMEEAIADNEVDLEVRKVGIERELEVIRVGPNPRIVTCRYWELASERICKVGVRTVANFVRGMKFRMAEPISEEEYRGVWRYEGRLPRHRGRW